MFWTNVVWLCEWKQREVSSLQSRFGSLTSSGESLCWPGCHHVENGGYQGAREGTLSRIWMNMMVTNPDRTFYDYNGHISKAQESFAGVASLLLVVFDQLFLEDNVWVKQEWVPQLGLHAQQLKQVSGLTAVFLMLTFEIKGNLMDSMLTCVVKLYEHTECCYAHHHLRSRKRLPAQETWPSMLPWCQYVKYGHKPCIIQLQYHLLSSSLFMEESWW